jgi:hypothetical protein
VAYVACSAQQNNHSIILSQAEAGSRKKALQNFRDKNFRDRLECYGFKGKFRWKTA